MGKLNENNAEKAREGGEKMVKGLVLIFGLIGGILAISGVFLSWSSIQAEVMGVNVTADIPGWDMARGQTTIMGMTVPGSSETSPYLVLAGGILALVGAFGALAARVKKVSILVLIGGVVAILGAAWGFSVVQTGTVSLPVIGSVTSSYGMGLYLCLIGGILALIGGVIGVRAEK